MDPWVGQELVLVVVVPGVCPCWVCGVCTVSVLGLGAPCVSCAHRARFLVDGAALEQSCFDSTSIHTCHSTLHPQRV